jgi:uncharacterized coiled-coil protein SlyX
MKSKNIRQKIQENLFDLRFRIALQEQIIDLLKDQLIKKLANPLYTNSLEDIIDSELRKQILNETN